MMFRRFLRLRDRDRSEIRDRHKTIAQRLIKSPAGPLPDPLAQPVASPSDQPSIKPSAQPGIDTPTAWQAAAIGAYLARINVYPIKSLPGLCLDRVAVTAAGALRGDRTWAIVDRSGRILNAKRSSLLHRIHAEFGWDDRQVRLTWFNPDPPLDFNPDGNPDGPASPTSDRSLEPATFHLDRDRSALAAWLSQALGQTVDLQTDPEAGFPDDRSAWGPTIISTATLETVATWFPGLSVDQIRRRFRANLELSGVPAFWEDGLFGPPDTPRSFRLGSIDFWAINPCQRCPVPTRDPDTGEADRAFQARFIDQRQRSLPVWVDRSWFNHFYRLAVNTRIDRQENSQNLDRVLTVGDRLQIL